MPRLLWIYLAFMVTVTLLIVSEWAHDSWFGALGTVIGLPMAIAFTILIIPRVWSWLRSPRPPKAPVPSERKQLRILIGMAVWTVLVLFLALGNSSDRYGNFGLGSFIAATIAFSSPALLFGGLWLWWLRRK